MADNDYTRKRRYVQPEDTRDPKLPPVKLRQAQARGERFSRRNVQPEDTRDPDLPPVKLRQAQARGERFERAIPQGRSQAVRDAIKNIGKAKKKD